MYFAAAVCCRACSMPPAIMSLAPLARICVDTAVRFAIARLIPTAAAFDSFWDSQIRETLTRCLLTKEGHIDGWGDCDHAG
jgi:hypothetical protein